MRKQQNNWPTPLTEVLERQLAPDASTVGEVLDFLVGRGDAIGVDNDGRLAVQQAAFDRLQAEFDERERIAQVLAEQAETIRLAKLEEQVERQEAQQEAAIRERTIRQRIARVEQATGVPMLHLEGEMRRARAHTMNTYSTIDQRQRDLEVVFTIGDVENFVKDTYGPQILEKEISK